jgi:hypothetical protein
VSEPENNNVYSKNLNYGREENNTDLENDPRIIYEETA